MRPFFHIVIFTLLSIVANAQSALESLVNAEKAFAQKSAETSTRTAFLSFLADSSVIFRPGPVEGKPFWEAAADDKDLLTWEPTFADVSAAGDLGYTTGPFEYRSGREDEKPAGTGHFVSVWEKQPDGSWKVALDLGIGHPPVEKPAFSTSAIPAVTAFKGTIYNTSPGPEEEFFNLEMEFAKNFNKLGLQVYKDWLSEEARLYRPGHAPYTNKDDISALLAATDKKFQFSPFRSFLAESGDLGYAYGGGVVTMLENSRSVSLNYLRIWKKENGRDWRIVLDLVAPRR